LAQHLPMQFPNDTIVLFGIYGTDRHIKMKKSVVSKDKYDLTSGLKGVARVVFLAAGYQQR